MIFRVLCWTAGMGILLEPAHAAGFIEEGAELPRFRLRTLDGELLSSADLAGKVAVLVFVRPGQPQSMVALRELERLRRATTGLSWKAVAICSGQHTPQAVQELAASTGFDGTLLVDPERAAYASFRVIAVPSVAVVDPELKVVYSRPGLGKDLFVQVRTHLYRAVGKTEGTEHRGAARPRRTAARIELSRVLAAEGHLERAEAVLRQALEEEDSLEGRLRLGDVLLERRQTEAALQVFRDAEEDFDAAFDAALGVARALAKLGRLDEAEAKLRGLALHHPDRWEAHFELGALHEARGKSDLALLEYKKAISILQRLLERRPADSESESTRSPGRGTTAD